MSDAARHDAWAAGDAYEAYMGRWSRRVAPHFVDWLAMAPGLEWIEVGCGTGALSAAIVDRAAPARLRAIEPSAGFLERARANVQAPQVEFLQGDARSLPLPTDSAEVAVSGLVLNFVPDRAQALAEMRRVVKPGGTVAFYVWDYPGGGQQFVRAFWEAATELDPGAAQFGEGRRFPYCTPDALRSMALEAGLVRVRGETIEVETRFRDFDDYWRPFTRGTGPAPGYCASLSPARRAELEALLRARLPAGSEGSITMTARAWAVRGIVA